MANDQGHLRPILLDTNVLSWLTDARNPRPEWAAVAKDRIPVLAFVTVGEILHATLGAGWPIRRIADVDARLRAYVVIPGTVGVARKYAELRRWFHKQIGDNDLWLAACALAQPDPLPLATADTDFDEIAKRFPLEVVRPKKNN